MKRNQLKGELGRYTVSAGQCWGLLQHSHNWSGLGGLVTYSVRTIDITPILILTLSVTDYVPSVSWQRNSHRVRLELVNLMRHQSPVTLFQCPVIDSSADKIRCLPTRDISLTFPSPTEGRSFQPSVGEERQALGPVSRRFNLRYKNINMSISIHLCRISSCWNIN